MKKSIITLTTSRSGYSIEQILDNYVTITAQELIDILKEFPPNTPVMFCNDNGYTYGHIYDQFINETEIDYSPSLDSFEIGEFYHIYGTVEDIVDQIDNPEEVFGMPIISTYILNSDVEILEKPDESGWVRVRIEYFNGREDIEAIVHVDLLSECDDEPF